MADLPRSPLVRWLPQPPRAQDFIWSTPDSLLNPPGLVPFAMLDWPNPRARVAIRQDWIGQSPLFLLGTLAPFLQAEWLPPQSAPRLRQDFVAGTPDTLLNPPGLTPTSLTDWPNPRGYPFPIENRTFLQGVVLPVNPPPSAVLPFSLSDWPNPRGPEFPLEDRGFTYSTDINLPVPPPVPPAPDTTNTPGRIERLPFSGRTGETEEEKHARRIREGSIPAPSLVSDDGRLAQYTEKSAKVMAAIAKLRRETEAVTQEALALRSRIEQARRAKARERLEHELLLKEQALTLARVQEVALLEELTVIDIAYVSVIALGVIIQ